MEPSDLRNRLLRALVDGTAGAPGGARLLDLDEDGVAWLTAGDEGAIILMPLPGRSSLQAAVEDLVATIERGTAHLAVVGGSAEARGDLQAAAPGFQLRRRIHLHHIDERADLNVISGEGSPTLERAARFVRLAPEEAPVEPLSADEIARLLSEPPAPAPAPPGEAPALAAAAALDAAPAPLARKGGVLGARLGPATALLGGLFVAGFLLQIVFGAGAAELPLERMGVLDAARVRGGEAWRILASLALSGSLWHFLLGLLALVSVAPLVESALGARRLLVLGGVAGLVGGATSVLVTPEGATPGPFALLGGITGAALALTLKPRDLFDGRARPELRIRALVSTVCLALAAFTLRRAPLAAPLLAGGGATGFLLAWGSALGLDGAATDGERGMSEPPPASPAGAFAWLSALCAALTLGLLTGRPWEIAWPPASVRIKVAPGLSLALPSCLLPRPTARATDGSELGFGDLARDPIEVSVLVGPEGELVPPDRVPAALSRLEEKVRSLDDPERTRLGPVRRERDGAWPAVVTEDLYPTGVRETARFTIVGGRTLALRVLVRPRAPAAWRTLADRLLSGLQKESDAALYGPACERERPDGAACRRVGSSYSEGGDAGRDDARARQAFQRGCEAGDAASCSLLGYAWSHGEGGAKNETEAARYYQLACDRNDPHGCANLGVLYEHGSEHGGGVKKDVARAAELYTRACDAGDGDSDACYALGMLTAEGPAGAGGKPDPEAAAVRFERACQLGLPRGCYASGLLYLSGTGVAKDTARAAVFEERACTGGEAKACAALAVLYRDGDGVPRNEERSTELFAKACQGGVTNVCPR